MQRLTAGLVEHRSKLLAQPAAQLFAACIRANPKFHGVAVRRSTRTRNAVVCWYVAYQSANPARHFALLGQQQAQRLQRAHAEGDRYVWVADLDRPGVWMLIAASAGVYECRDGAACNCPDYVDNCKPAGLSCKHLLAHRLGLGTWYTSEQFTQPAAQHYVCTLHPQFAAPPASRASRASTSAR